jgi:hypothetical protein
LPGVVRGHCRSNAGCETDKVEDAKAKQRVREQIDADRRARAEKAAREKALREGQPVLESQTQTQGQGQGASSSSSTANAKKEYTETRLQVRPSVRPSVRPCG